MINSRSKSASAPASTPPRVERVVTELSLRIKQGRLRPGDQLPTLRELGRAFGVSYGVVHAAFHILQEKGLIEKIHGSGTYVKRRGSSKIGQRKRSDVYILIHGVRHGFSPPLQMLLRTIQDNGLTPIPLEFDRFQPDRVQQLIGIWHESPPLAVLVRGAPRLLAESVQKHSPAATRFIVVYNQADGTNPHWHSVRPDEFLAYRLAATHLIELGHRRIGLPVSHYEGMTQEAVNTMITAKVDGIRRAFSDAGLPEGLVLHENEIPRKDTSSIGLTTENVLRTARWLTGSNRPSALVENTYRMPFIAAAAREAGLALGSDLPVVGIGDPTPAKQGEYPCVSEQYDEIARYATNMILAEEEDFDQVGRQIIVPPVFVSQWQPSTTLSQGAEVEILTGQGHSF